MQTLIPAAAAPQEILWTTPPTESELQLGDVDVQFAQAIKAAEAEAASDEKPLLAGKVSMTQRVEASA